VINLVDAEIQDEDTVASDIWYDGGGFGTDVARAQYQVHFAIEVFSMDFIVRTL